METQVNQSGSSAHMNYFLLSTTQVRVILSQQSSESDTNIYTMKAFRLHDRMKNASFLISNSAAFTATFLTGVLRTYAVPDLTATRHTCKLFDYVTNRCLCLFPAEKCECKEQTLTNSKLFCTMSYAYGKNSNIHL